MNKVETPINKHTIAVSNKLKKEKIAYHFAEIMDALGLDLTDDSLKETPNRVAKMYVDEIFSGLISKNKPEIKLFENKYEYQQILLEKDITFYSNCEHHFVPIIGKAHVAYIPNEKVIGLSKLNRIVRYFAARPQVQERLTQQIGRDLQALLETKDIAVIIDAKHLCVSMRGIKDDASSTTTVFFGGAFKKVEKQQELISYLK